MMKKLSILALVSACSMIAAPKVKAPQTKAAPSKAVQAPQAKKAEVPAIQKRDKKVRMVTLGDREVALIQEAHAKAQEAGKDAPLIAQHVAAGNREVSRDEHNALLHEALTVLGRENRLVM